MSGQWYALAGAGGYLGREWELYNGTLRRPRVAIVGLQDCDTHTRGSIAEARRIGEAILGIALKPVPIWIDGAGPGPDGAKVKLGEQPCGRDRGRDTRGSAGDAKSRVGPRTTGSARGAGGSPKARPRRTGGPTGRSGDSRS